MADQRKPERGFILPNTVDPPRLHVCVPVPNDPYHKSAFLRQIHELSWAKNWQNDGTSRGLDTSYVWKEIYSDVEARLGVEECDGSIPYCRYYPNTHPIFSYSPNDPRYTPDFVPDGYLFPPWYFATDVSELVYGTQAGDIVNSIERIAGSLLPILNLFAEVPKATIRVNGIGTIKIYVRSLFLGSMIWLVPDGLSIPPVTYDTNKDTLSLPAETGDVLIFEYEFTTDEPHTLEIYVVSRLNDELPFLYHGAAIIGAELCGFGNLECAGMDCCEDLLKAINELQEYNERRENEARAVEYDETPTSINPSAPGDFFADGSEDRNTALCLAIWTYVVHQLTERAERDCAESAAIVALILGGVGSLFGPIGGIIGGLVGGVVGGALCAELTAWASDEDAVRETICEIYNSLHNVVINQQNFEGAFTSITGGGSEIKEALAADAAKLENYLYFVDLLGEGYEQALNGVTGDCDCEPHVCTFDFRVSGYGAVFSQGSRVPGVGLVNSTEHLPGNWRFTGGIDEFNDDGECGGESNIYYRIVASEFSGDQPIALGLFRGGSLFIGGSIGVSGSEDVITGEWSSGGSGPATGFRLFISNGATDSNCAIHSLELSDTPF